MITRGNNRGFGLVEVVVATAVLAGALLAFALYYQRSLQIGNRTTEMVQANFFIEEGIEAVKLFRDESWSGNIATLSVGTPYYLEFSGGSWATTTNNVYTDGLFERSFILENVYRDGNDDIAASGTLDSGTKKLTVNVSWWRTDDNATTTRSIATYITDLLGN